MTDGTVSSTALAGVRIEFDPNVWLKAPTDPGENAGWVATMVEVHTRGWDLEPGSSDVEYLRRTLSAFVDSDLDPPNRFLRLARGTQTPIVATVAILVGRPEGEVRQVVEWYDDSLPYYDPPSLEVIGPDRGLVRALRYAVHPGGSITGSIRYHRREDDLACDVVLVSEGADLIGTAQALDDLDQLARAVWLIDSEGARH